MNNNIHNDIHNISIKRNRTLSRRMDLHDYLIYVETTVLIFIILSRSVYVSFSPMYIYNTPHNNLIYIKCSICHFTAKCTNHGFVNLPEYKIPFYEECSGKPKS